VAARVDEADLSRAARQIDEIHAAAQTSPAALLARLDHIERRLERIEAERATT
jgi:hypothetical protein